MWNLNELALECLMLAEAPHMNWMRLGFALANFAILIVVLKKIAGKSLANMAGARHEQIKSDLEEAALLRANAEAKLKECEGRVEGIEREMDQLLATMRDEANAEKARIVAQGEDHARFITSEATRLLAAEIARVEMEVRREAVRAAIAAAEKILRERVNIDEERHLIDRFSRELEGRL